MKPQRLLRLQFVGVTLAMLVASIAFAQSTYPNRTVKVIVPWPPGQATDLSARLVADKLSQAFGQAFVIENKPGAGGQIGTDQVAKSAPDGYTLLAASSGPYSIAPNLQKLPYEPLKDFAPISLISAAPFALVTHPNFPAANLKEFIALVKANPDKYTCSCLCVRVCVRWRTGPGRKQAIAAQRARARQKPPPLHHHGSLPALVMGCETKSSPVARPDALQPYRAAWPFVSCCRWRWA